MISLKTRHQPFLSARQYARAYTVYSGLVVWSGLVTVPKFLPLVPLFTVSAAGLDSVFPFKDYIVYKIDKFFKRLINSLKD